MYQYLNVSSLVTSHAFHALGPGVARKFFKNIIFFALVVPPSDGPPLHGLVDPADYFDLRIFPKDPYFHYVNPYVTKKNVLQE